MESMVTQRCQERSDRLYLGGPMKRSGKIKSNRKPRNLIDLISVGPATTRDLAELGIHAIENLARSDPVDLYQKLCAIRGRKMDPCCQDVFAAAIAQAQDENLPAILCRWSSWSRIRKMCLSQGKRPYDHQVVERYVMFGLPVRTK